MRPPFRHAAFFYSLKQVEKRLASENPSFNNKPSRNLPSTSSTESLGSPILLNYSQPNSLDNEESEPPQEFLSHSIAFPPSPKHPPPSDAIEHDTTVNHNDSDGIEQLMDLLCLSDCGERKGNLEGGSCCFCKGGFYSKVAGVKGPKCDKEMERLEGWIRLLSNDGGETREPMRLAHLLLAKAVCLDDASSFGETVFPSTIEEYLEKDPPS